MKKIIRKGVEEREKAKRKEEHSRFHQLPINDVQLASFESRLRINPENIDQEVMEQPSTYYEVADALALARSRRDLSKDEYKTVEASLGLQIREERQERAEKTTESMISDLVQIDKRRIEAFQEYVEMEREVGRLEALRDSFRDRGFMLRELAELHMQGMSQQNSVKSTDYAKREYDAEQNRKRMAEVREQRAKDREGQRR